MVYRFWNILFRIKRSPRTAEWKGRYYNRLEVVDKFRNLTQKVAEPEVFWKIEIISSAQFLIN